VPPCQGSQFPQQTLISAFLAAIVADLVLKANIFNTSIANCCIVLWHWKVANSQRFGMAVSTVDIRKLY
jgi:hypothetical protein